MAIGLVMWLLHRGCSYYTSDDVVISITLGMWLLHRGCSHYTGDVVITPGMRSLHRACSHYTIGMRSLHQGCGHYTRDAVITPGMRPLHRGCGHYTGDAVITPGCGHYTGDVVITLVMWFAHQWWGLFPSLHWYNVVIAPRILSSPVVITPGMCSFYLYFMWSGTVSVVLYTFSLLSCRFRRKQIPLNANQRKRISHHPSLPSSIIQCKESILLKGQCHKLVCVRQHPVGQLGHHRHAFWFPV